mmetsp:Transcript_40304/g.64753  ORF Transcript_40304/g.64753 Transcript_40304/m.64753 type:complete len:190 (+) Transcript_40304:40-609(+)
MVPWTTALFPLLHAVAFAAPVSSPRSRPLALAGALRFSPRSLRRLIVPVGAEPISAQRIKTPRWDGSGGVSEYLNNQGLQSLPPMEVAERMKQGWVLVDVRRADQFEDSRAAGSENVELFQLLPFGGSPRNTLKYLLTTSQGATPVDPNPQFIEEIQGILQRPDVKGVVLADAEGGCLDDADGRLGQYV